MTPQSFPEFFEKALSNKPRPWQTALAADCECQNRLIRIPTGFGKTLGVFGAWLYHRVQRQDASWPRRLVWCLPMRVLVEQTEAEISGVLKTMGLLWDGGQDHQGKIGVHTLMGGADSGGWHLYPEECSVLIGTQDMLLSRALNRGYAAARAKWPMEFGLLNQDALWIMDEVQLMDVGLATSAQLQAFRQDDGAKELRPCRTWWMSATLQEPWLESVDTRGLLQSLPAVQELKALDKEAGLWRVRKPCRVEKVSDEDIADLVTKHHQVGALTLVVVNTVDRALSVHAKLDTKGRNFDLRLVHSRFRPLEKNSWRQDFLSRTAALPSGGRVIVATQVIEAGVDISAKLLITDLAPWPNLVQRFGRCARYESESGEVIVMDCGLEADEKKARPYNIASLAGAKKALEKLEDAAPAALAAFEEGLGLEERLALYPYTPEHLLLRREWDELFDTTPDLSGADIDISRFIRSGDEMDLLVFWRDIPADGPSDKWKPWRLELCPVSFLKARDWLCGKKSGTSEPKKIKRNEPQKRPVAWVWDWLDGAWKTNTERGDLLPGRIVLVAADFGGYSLQRGWDPNEKKAPQAPAAAPSMPEENSDDAQSNEDLSEAAWKTIATHGQEVAALALKIADKLALSKDLGSVLDIAGLWHDVGKVHPCFQGSIRLDSGRPKREDIAKAPQTAWGRKHLYHSVSDGDYRPGFRHELASGLALFSMLEQGAPGHPVLSPRLSELLGSAPAQVPTRTLEVWEKKAAGVVDVMLFNLIAYLVVAHHGKVRLRLHASPQDQDYRAKDNKGLPIRGVREGDVLAPVLGSQPLTGPQVLTLEPVLLGLSERTGPSWTERTLDLQGHFGPGSLALLEAIIRAADIRASRNNVIDPLLNEGGEA
jgi:CRISPR-associated endonuclease/helicase Cas3